jgi:hypothetical protein
MTEAAAKEKPEYSLPEKTAVYRRRFRRAIEQVFIDEKDQAVDLSESVSNLLSPGNSRYKRTVAALRIISDFAPQMPMKKLRERYSYKQDSMPFSLKDYTLKEKIGFGGMNDVFLLQARKKDVPSYVLKISLGESGERLEKLLSTAKEQKEDYERIATAYKDVPDVILKEYYLVMHGPSMRQPVAVSIQPFVGENLRDIFVDFEKDELQDLLQKNKPLHEQLDGFVKATRADNSLVENELDVLGRNNLAIVGGKGEERLLMLDPHFRSSRSRSPHYRNQIEERIRYLEELTKASS